MRRGLLFDALLGLDDGFVVIGIGIHTLQQTSGDPRALFSEVLFLLLCLFHTILPFNQGVSATVSFNEQAEPAIPLLLFVFCLRSLRSWLLLFGLL